MTFATNIICIRQYLINDIKALSEAFSKFSTMIYLYLYLMTITFILNVISKITYIFTLSSMLNAFRRMFYKNNQA